MTATPLTPTLTALAGVADQEALAVWLWDRLEQLIAAIEVRFHIKFATKELRSIKTVGDLAALVDSKLA